MNVGLYRAAVAMVGQERRLDAIASNLANVDTVGYKRGTTASHEFQVPRGRNMVRGLAVRGRIDFAQGDLRRTGRALDLALWGEGFFVIDGPQGEVYARDGAFQVTSEGVLVTDEGSPVAWERRGGVIDPTGLPVTVAEDGVLRQGETRLGQIKIVNFERPHQLRRGEGGTWVAPANMPPATHTAVVHQYTLEESNASGVDEMIAMIGVQRTFQTAANVFSSIEDSYRRLTRPF